MISSALVSAMESYNKALSELRQASVEQEFGCAVAGEWYSPREEDNEYYYFSSVVGCPQEGGTDAYKFSGWKLVLHCETMQISRVTLFVRDAQDMCECWKVASGLECSFVKHALEELALSFGALVEKY